MNNKKKQAVETAEKILKEMTTPEERGFVCMYPDNCETCIKAAEVGLTTTACEDELEDDHYREKTKKLDGKFELGIYTTPHISYNEPDPTALVQESIKKIWRAWIRLSEGGIMGIPFPAKNEILAVLRANNACNIFNGELLELEDLGYLELKP